LPGFSLAHGPPPALPGDHIFQRRPPGQLVGRQRGVPPGGEVVADGAKATAGLSWELDAVVYHQARYGLALVAGPLISHRTLWLAGPLGR